MRTGTGRGARGVALLALLAAAAAACGKPASLDELPDELSCRRTVAVGEVVTTESAEGTESDPTETTTNAGTTDTATTETTDGAEPGVRVQGVEWRLPQESTTVYALNAWCAHVGPAVVGGWGDPEAGSEGVDTLVVGAWNMHVGGGDVRALVSDLRAGRLTGGSPVEHFVLLIQETYRSGDLVPAHDPLLPGGSAVLDAPAGNPRSDIVELAEELGLWLVYVPSMRNGEHEDRGNAMLSTLPLRSPVAVGLPVARQRRVAVAARVAARTRSGRDWRIQVASVHLESDAGLWANDEEARLRQARSLLELLPESDAALAGGDFNTKDRGQSEALVFDMLDAYPDTPPFPPGPTYARAFGIYREYIDYLFFRLPDGTPARYRRANDLYGSDHYPLIGTIAWDRPGP